MPANSANGAGTFGEPGLPPRASALRKGVVLVLALAAIVLIALTAQFNYLRLGIFPHDVRQATYPCCGGAAGKPADQLAQIPLAAGPLVAEATRLKQSDPARARKLMLAAVARDPLSPEARAWLAADAAMRGDFPDTIVQLDWLYTLDAGSRPRAAKALAGLARFPASQAAVSAFAKRQPIWLNAVAEELVRSDADPAILFRVLGGAGPRINGSDKGGYDASVIDQLIKRKQYDLAYLAWVTQLPEGALDKVGYVYDGQFAKLPGSPPFNWRLTDNGEATVDYTKGGGLQVSYFGDGASQFAAQTLLLPPGAYRIAAAANRSGKADGNLAFFTLACAATPDTPLVTLDIPVGNAPARIGGNVTIADGCDVQVLALAGRPSDYPSTMQIAVTSVAITGAQP
ncbi:hypothetical protein [Sphingomonas immobilis]|uniref:Uncharacterized protein n=1 Tax=Sphingomonas immobilis TaxID=3063997 RepID=A0ABT8ZUP3_9SPHN|nr:hypothetical protein [Sphingomonas sp. CA1-15]MDO7840932.1 hypothetical protein [Sphingomonas sp. CA1-15]